MTESLMSGEKRKNLRRSITYPAFIDLGDGSPLRECTFCDASQDGALLAVADPNSVPDEFILALSSDGTARRCCRVAWRTEDQVGVRFVKNLRPTTPPMPKRPSAPVPQPAGAKAPLEPAERVDVDTLTPR